jgi:hypothetical protein
LKKAGLEKLFLGLGVIMTNTKHYRIILLLIIVCYVLIFVIACDGDSASTKSDGSVWYDGTDVSVNLFTPTSIAALTIDNLYAQVTIDGTSTYPLNVDLITNEVSGTITGVSAGTHDLEITYYVILSGVNVVLCSSSTQVTVNTGQTSSVTIQDSDLDRNIDDDDDGYTNLAEVRIGTNPLSPLDVPGGGLPRVICGDGMIQKVSSGNYTIKLIVGSSMAESVSSTNYKAIVPYIGYD